MTAPQVESKFLFAYNPGPGTIAYLSPRPGEVPDLVLRPWEHTPVDRAYLEQPYFRRDMKAKRFTTQETVDMPPPVDHQISPDYYDKLDPANRQLVLRLCAEEFNDQFKDAIGVDRHISANGIPAANSRVTVVYLKDTHLLALRAALDLEKRWRNRKPVLTELNRAIKRIEAL